MKRAVAVIVAILMICAPAAAERLKDIVHIEGIIDNNLSGFGLVVGLSGTGDSKGYASKALANMMKRLLEEYSIAPEEVQGKNIALVAVTATLPAFSKVGTTIDIKVSAIGTATSLKGGELLETHLKAEGDDETVYALAHGSVLLAGSDTTVPTKGEIVNGAIVAEEEPTNFIKQEGGLKKVSLLLTYPDFNTANSIVEAIRSDRQLFGRYGEVAKAINAGQVDIIVTSDADEVNFISKVLDVTVDVHNKARVVINERTRSIVIGEGVTVLPVIICHGDLIITIGTEEQRLARMEARGGTATPLQQIQDMLNAIKAKPEDIIAIIMALKAAGALQGEVIVK
jgi:flagellar P-ring protein precursor FlgI